jgi:hypothetical protein
MIKGPPLKFHGTRDNLALELYDYRPPKGGKGCSWHD